jgi:hypothetical protein
LPLLLPSVIIVFLLSFSNCEAATLYLKSFLSLLLWLTPKPFITYVLLPILLLLL